MTAAIAMSPTTSLGSDFWAQGIEVWPKVTGRQEPHHVVATPGSFERGEKTLLLMDRMKSPLMPWQGGVVRLIESTTAGRWSHTDCVWICTRQNGKSEGISAIVIRRTIASGEKVLYTAQRWKTAKELYERTLALIWSRPSLRRRIVKRTCSQGEGVLVFDNGGVVTFTTRSPDAGRGLTKLDTVIYDEAYNLSEGEMSALNYAQDAAEDPQTIYVSSAVNANEHPKGAVLSGLRRQALEGVDPQMMLVEYMAPAEMDRMAESTWQYANPAYGFIKTEAKIRKNMRGMATEAGQLAFDVEALGRGLWFEPEASAEDSEPVIDGVTWRSLVDRSPVRTGHYVITVDADQDETVAAIATTVKTASGAHSQVVYDGPFNVDEVVRRVKALTVKDEPAVVVLDPKSSAGAFRSPLERAGVEVTAMTFAQVRDACRDFLIAVRESADESGPRRFTHDDDPRLDEALVVAEVREFESGKAWERRSGRIASLVAVSFGVWALDVFAPRLMKAAEIRTVSTGRAAAGSQWQSMDF